MAYSILTEEPRTLLSGISCDTNLLHGVNTREAAMGRNNRPSSANGTSKWLPDTPADVSQGQMGVDRQAFLLGVATQ